MEAAHDWGMPRSTFMALSDEDRAWAMAYTATRARMRAWELQEQEREMERASRRGR